MKKLLSLLVFLFVFVSLFGISQRYQNQIIAAPGCNNDNCSCGSVTECNSGYHCRNGLCVPPDNSRKGASCDLCLNSDQCDPNLGATQGCWGGYCLPCGSPDPTSTPPASKGTINGRVTSNPGAKSVANVPVTVYSELGQLGTVYTDGSGNYSISFTYSGLGNFAVRAGNDALGGNSGFGSATGTGSETVCTSSGSLVKHEMCPSSSVIGKTLSGFDFIYNVSCTYGMTYETLKNCSEGMYTSRVSGVSGASDVRFATWSSTGGQNDLVWYIGNNLGGGNYNYTVNSASHQGSNDTIFTDTWIGKCTSGLCPQIYCGGTRVTRACVPSPTPTPTRTPTPTPCVVPAKPTGLTSSLNLAAEPPSVTLDWNNVPGATVYSLQVDDTSDGWVGPNDTYLPNLTVSTYTRSVVRGRSYTWWVHAGNICGWSPAEFGNFTVPTVPPTPTLPPPPNFVCTSMTIENLTTQIGAINDGERLRFHARGTAPANSTISGTVTVSDGWTSPVIGQANNSGNFDLATSTTNPYIAQTGTWTANAVLNIQ